jgi:FxLD family lantipeptide
MNLKFALAVENRRKVVNYRVSPRRTSVDTVVAQPVTDPFALEMQIVTHEVADNATPCDTSDGCAATCASSCASRG